MNKKHVEVVDGLLAVKMPYTCYFPLGLCGDEAEYGIEDNQFIVEEQVHVWAMA